MTEPQGPWDEIAKNHVIHEESYSFVERLQAKGAKPFCDMDLEEAKVQSEQLAVELSGEIDFPGEVREIVIPSPYSKEGIPTTIYKPANCPETPIIFIYFHGGGLVLFSRKCYEACLQTIARDSGAIVLNVEYRLMSETETPAAPFDDAVHVTRWVLDNREAVGGGSDSKVGVGGDSAGGQLTISVTNEVQGLDFQVLIYPNSDLSFEQPSFQEFASCPGLSGKDVEWFSRHSLDRIPGCVTNPRINGMARTNTELSPPALILLAEIDPLRDSGMAYAEKLRGAGVSVRIVIIEGVPHVFFGLPGHFKTKCEEAYGHVVQFITDFSSQ